MKWCPGCQQNLPVEKFGVDSHRKDSLRACCKLCATAKSKAWQAKNKEKVKAYRKSSARKESWRKFNNSDHAKDYRRKYGKSDKAREGYRKKHYRRRAAENNCDSDLGATGFLDLLNFYGERCMKCGSPNNLTHDHIKPVSRGGAHTYANSQILCSPCNSAKGSRNENDYRPLRILTGYINNEPVIVERVDR